MRKTLVAAVIATLITGGFFAFGAALVHLTQDFHGRRVEHLIRMSSTHPPKMERPQPKPVIIRPGRLVDA